MTDQDSEVEPIGQFAMQEPTLMITLNVNVVHDLWKDMDEKTKEMVVNDISFGWKRCKKEWMIPNDNDLKEHSF